MSDSTNILINGKTPPPWATEKTQDEILDTLNKIAKGLKITPAEKNKEKKAQEKVIKSLGDFEKMFKKAGGTLNAFDDEFKTAGKETKTVTKANKELKKSLNMMGKSFLDNIGVSGKFTGALSKGAKVGSIYAFAVTAAVSALVTFKDMVLETAAVNQEMYDTGITLQRNLFDLRVGAGMAAMSLPEFASIMKENSQLIASYGRNGVIAFAGVVEQTRKLTFAQAQYGLTTEELTGYTADYLEMMRVQGSLSKLSELQQSQKSAEFLKEITLYSQVMGVSRKEIVGMMKSSSEDIQAMAALNEQGRKNFTKFQAGFGAIFGDSGKFLSDTVSRIITTMGGEFSDKFIAELNVVGAGNIAESLQYLKANINTMTDDEILNLQASVIEKFQGMSQDQLDRIEHFSQINSFEYMGQISALRRMSQNIDKERIAALRSGQLKEQDELTSDLQKARIHLNEILGRITVQFSEFLAQNVGLMEQIASGLEKTLSWIHSILVRFNLVNEQASTVAVSAARGNYEKLVERQKSGENISEKDLAVAKTLADGIAKLPKNLGDQLNSWKFLMSGKELQIESAANLESFVKGAIAEGSDKNQIIDTLSPLFENNQEYLHDIIEKIYKGENITSSFAPSKTEEILRRLSIFRGTSEEWQSLRDRANRGTVITPQNTNLKTAKESHVAVSQTSPMTEVIDEHRKTNTLIEKSLRTQEEQLNQLSGVAKHSKDTVNINKRTLDVTKSNRNIL